MGWGPDIFGWEGDEVEEGRGVWKLWRWVLLSVCLIMGFRKALSSFYTVLKDTFNKVLFVCNKKEVKVQFKIVIYTSLHIIVLYRKLKMFYLDGWKH